MSEIRISTKPTLEGLLVNPQGDDKKYVSPEKVVFPKINTKLKKTHFTKYHSAFLSAKSCGIDEQTVLNKITPQKMPSKKMNTQSISVIQSNQCKQKFQLNRNVWKLNKKCQLSNLTDVSPKRNRSLEEINELLQGKYSQGQKINLNSSNNKIIEGKKNDRFIQLQEIRKLNISPISFAQTERNKKIMLRSNQEINENINRSNKIISLIRKNDQNKFFQNAISQDKQDQIEKFQEKLGLFSYLKRNFITKKQKLTPQKVKEYFQTPSNRKLQAQINFQSRNFLQDKLHNDYHSHKQVNKLRQDLSLQAIQQQIQFKNTVYHQQYNKKYNIPYLSFLSLPKKLKVKVLKNLTEQPALIKIKKKQ